MKRLFLGVFVALAMLSGGSAAQLPESVTRPYGLYLEAIENEDIGAASRHAFDAWTAGLENGVDTTSLRAIGSNAFVTGRQAQAWENVVAITGPLARLEASAGDYETALLILVEGRGAAFQIDDRLAARSLHELAVLMFTETHEVDIEWITRIVVQDEVRYEDPVEDIWPVFEDALRDENGQAEGLVNIALMLLDNIESSDPAVYRDVLERTFNRLTEMGYSDAVGYGALLDELAWTMQFAGVRGNGLEWVPVSVRDQWCQYLEDHPVIEQNSRYVHRGATLFPSRALEYGRVGAVTRVTVIAPADGGRPALDSRAVEYRGGRPRSSSFARASERALEATPLRPTCSGGGESRRIEVFEVFSQVSVARYSSGATFGLRTFRFVRREG